MAKKKTPNDIKMTPELCNLKHEAVDSRFDTVLSKVENTSENVKEMKEILRTMQEEHRKTEDSLKSQIKMTESAIYNKVDKLYETIKGNGKIGLVEQVKKLNWKMWIIGILLILLLGAKFMGIGLEDIKNTMFGQKMPTPIIKKEDPNKAEHIQINIHQNYPSQINTPPKETPVVKDSNNIKK